MELVSMDTSWLPHSEDAGLQRSKSLWRIDFTVFDNFEPQLCLTVKIDPLVYFTNETIDGLRSVSNYNTTICLVSLPTKS